MMQRGVVVSSATIRQWCQKFGQAFANPLRRRGPRRGEKWHLDEVFIRINGKTHSLASSIAQLACGQRLANAAAADSPPP